MESKGVRSFLKSNLNVQQDICVYMHIYAYVCVYVFITHNCANYMYRADVAGKQTNNWKRTSGFPGCNQT